MINKNTIQKLIGVVIALVIWQLVAMLVKQPILLVTPVSVCKRLATIWLEAEFWKSIGFSMVRIIGGFFLGLTVGSSLAILSNRFKLAENLLWPYMVTIRSVPVASIVVICLLWLSSKNLSVFISFLIVVPVIYQNVLTGLRNRDIELEEAAMVNGATFRQRFRYVNLPQLAPYLISACTVTIGMSWKAGVAAEIIGTPKGSIGQKLYLAKIYIDTDDLLAWTVVLVILSIICEKLIIMLIKTIIRKLSLTAKNT